MPTASAYPSPLRSSNSKLGTFQTASPDITDLDLGVSVEWHPNFIQKY